jgi:Prokaryotic N-terminal methylation motif
MKNYFLISNSQGYSLIEIIISAAILMIAILGANLQYIQQMQAQSGVSLQIGARQLLNQSISTVTGNPALFPKIVSGTQSLSYVGCFQENGVQQGHDYDPVSPGPTPTAIPTPSFVGVFITGNLGQPASDPERPGSYICTQNKGGFEVHITWDSSNIRRIVYIDVITLFNGNPSANKNYRQYSPSVTSIRSTVYL